MIELDLLRHPEKEVTATPVDMWLGFREAVRKKKAAIPENTFRAAHKKSVRKAASSRRNGAKDGRPRKKQEAVLV